MAGNLRTLPRPEMRIKFAAQLGYFAAQPFELCIGVLVARQTLQIVNFFLKLFQLALPRLSHFLRRFLVFLDGHALPCELAPTKVSRRRSFAAHPAHCFHQFWCSLHALLRRHHGNRTIRRL